MNIRHQIAVYSVKHVFRHLAQIQLCSFGLAEESLQGDPQLIRIIKEDFSETTGVICYLQESTRYLPSSKMAERHIYRSDGTLSYRWEYEYNAAGFLKTLTTFDGTGAKVCVRHLSSPDPRIEESVVLDVNGKELDRTSTRLDEFGQVLETTSSSDQSRITTRIQYDAQGRPTEMDVEFEHLPQMSHRFEMDYLANGQQIVTMYTPQGTPLARNEAYMDSSVRRVSQLNLAEAGAQSNTTIEQIESRDAKGNWTKKVVLKGDGSATPPKKISVVYREIFYY